MEALAYWKLRTRLAEATILQMKAENMIAQAIRDSEAAFLEAGVSLKPNSQVRFNDETTSLEVTE